MTKTTFAFINVQEKKKENFSFYHFAFSLLPGKWLCNALSVFQCELSLTALFRIPVLIHCHAVFKRLIDGKTHKNFYHVSGAQKRNISGGILTSLTKRHFRRSPAMHSVLHWLNTSLILLINITVVYKRTFFAPPTSWRIRFVQTPWKQNLATESSKSVIVKHKTPSMSNRAQITFVNLRLMEKKPNYNYPRNKLKEQPIPSSLNSLLPTNWTHLVCKLWNIL